MPFYPYVNQYPYQQNQFYPQTPPAQVPQIPQVPQMQTTPQPVQQSGIVWVQGEEGAKAYMVGAGNSVLLMDSEASSFYIKSSDASGMPQPLRIFDYTERNAQPAEKKEEVDFSQFVTRKELEEILASRKKVKGDKDE